MFGSGETSEGTSGKHFGRGVWPLAEITSKEGDTEEGRPEMQHVIDSGNRKMVLSLNSHFGNDCN